MSEVQKPNEWSKWICSSQNIVELRENYEQWANTYEIDVGGVWGVSSFRSRIHACKIDEQNDGDFSLVKH